MVIVQDFSSQMATYYINQLFKTNKFDRSRDEFSNIVLSEFFMHPFLMNLNFEQKKLSQLIRSQCHQCFTRTFFCTKFCRQKLQS